MKAEIKRDRQAAACIEFERTLKRRPERFCWRNPWEESALHSWWRINAYLLWRCRLWLRAGLGDFPGLQRMLRSTAREERAARRAWEEEEKRERAEFLRSRTAAAEGLARYEGGGEYED
jgi:hypothetical protein